MSSQPIQPFTSLSRDVDLATVAAVCIGTGRFLRAVLVPSLAEIGCEVVLAQTRGRSFQEHMAKRLPGRSYEVDTVLQDGRVLTHSYPVAAVGSLGDAAGRAAFMELPKRMRALRYVGIGLTEAGITHNGRSILDLAEFLHGCFVAGLGAEAPLSVLNTDNIPFNGDAIRQHVGSCDFTQSAAAAGFVTWLETCAREISTPRWSSSHELPRPPLTSPELRRVVFHNSMVDRITSHRDDDSDVPRAEPLPAKVCTLHSAPCTARPPARRPLSPGLRSHGGSRLLPPGAGGGGSARRAAGAARVGGGGGSAHPAGRAAAGRPA